MGFNIGVSSEQLSSSDCHVFVDSAFYNFINSGEQYGDQSVLIQSGQYYGLDLSPLLKLVYTWDDISQEDIQANLQNTEDLLSLISSYRDRIIADRTVCDKINYKWYESRPIISDKERQELISEVGESAATDFLDMNEEIRKDIEANPNPWRSYFTEGQIVNDLTSLIKSIECFKNKGATEVYLTAG